MIECLTLGDAVMWVVARRIARLHVTNPAEAEADYKAHVSVMTDDERAIFDSVFLGFMIEMRG